MTKTAKTIFFIAGMIAFALLVGSFGVEKLVTNIGRVGWWFVAIIGIWGLVYLLNTGAWFLILKDREEAIGFWKVFQICVSGFAINYVTPFVGLGGEPYRVLALKKLRGLNGSLSAVILYSMLHFLSSFVFWIVAIIIMVAAFPLLPDVRVALMVILVVSVVSIWFMISRHANGIFGPIIRLMRRIPFMEKISGRLEKKRESLLEIDREITGLYKNRKITFYAALSLEFLARVVSSVEYIFILQSIGIGISFLQAIYVGAGFSLVLNVFFFIPFELGVREGGLYLILKGLGLTSSIGIFVAIVTRIRELFWILIGLVMVQLSDIFARRQPSTELLSSKDRARTSTIYDGDNK